MPANPIDSNNTDYINNSPKYFVPTYDIVSRGTVYPVEVESTSEQFANQYTSLITIFFKYYNDGIGSASTIQNAYINLQKLFQNGTESQTTFISDQARRGAKLADRAPLYGNQSLLNSFSVLQNSLIQYNILSYTPGIPPIWTYNFTDANLRSWAASTEAYNVMTLLADTQTCWKPIPEIASISIERMINEWMYPQISSLITTLQANQEGLALFSDIIKLKSDFWVTGKSQTYINRIKGTSRCTMDQYREAGDNIYGRPVQIEPNLSTADGQAKLDSLKNRINTLISKLQALSPGTPGDVASISGLQQVLSDMNAGYRNWVIDFANNTNDIEAYSSYQEHIYTGVSAFEQMSTGTKESLKLIFFMVEQFQKMVSSVCNTEQQISSFINRNIR